MDLPKHCPPELELKLEVLLGYRETNAAEIWGAVRAWLLENENPILTAS